MAIVSVHYADLPTANYSRRLNGTYTQKWFVETDAADAPDDVLNAAITFAGNTPIPALYDSYSVNNTAGTPIGTDANSYAQEFSIQPRFGIQQPLHWVVQVTYSPLPDGKESSDLVVNPLLRGVEYSADWEVYTDVVEEDKDGNQIVNTAGKPFDINVEMERSRTVLVASYNVESLGMVISKMRKYQDAVNSEVWSLGSTNVPKRAALCRSVQSTGLLTEGDTSYYRLIVRISFKEEDKTWDERLLSRGYGYLVAPNDLDSYTTEDRDGDTLDEPMLLKQDGTPKQPADDPYYKEYRVRAEQNFANIFNYQVV